MMSPTSSLIVARPRRPFTVLVAAHFHATLLALASVAISAELRVSTDFEGGSARVESVDQASRTIRFTPAGDPQRGWPCWWYLRVDGVSKDARLTLDLGASATSPLKAEWAMPDRATFSTDGETWQHTEPGRHDGQRMLYEVTGTGHPIWLAWGPPFTPRDTDALLAAMEKALPSAKSFELAKTREGRAVKGLQVNEAKAAKPPGVWVLARQHAWESGGSWVARGFMEWIASDEADARWLRSQAEIFIVPIMDVDNVATGNGGKEANPRDHNRDWAEQPVYPEVAAAQQRLRAMVKDGRLSIFLDLHNPGPGDHRPFFFVGPEELLSPEGKANRANFLAAAVARITGPLPVEKSLRSTGAKYHPLFRQISGVWVDVNGNPNTVAACLETPWNTPQSTTQGYRTVGKQLAQAVADHLRQRGK